MYGVVKEFSLSESTPITIQSTVTTAYAAFAEDPAAGRTGEHVAAFGAAQIQLGIRSVSVNTGVEDERAGAAVHTTYAAELAVLIGIDITTVIAFEHHIVASPMIAKRSLAVFSPEHNERLDG